jgi:HEPN domain-containing protein
MLHQSTEHALRALLFSVTAYNSYNHNLDNLLRHCNYCAPELNKIFPRNTDKEKESFNLLNSAYVHSRYKSNYEISTDDLMLLLDRVDHLQIEVKQFFEERLIAFKNSFNH